MFWALPVRGLKDERVSYCKGQKKVSSWLYLCCCLSRCVVIYKTKCLHNGFLILTTLVAEIVGSEKNTFRANLVPSGGLESKSILRQVFLSIMVFSPPSFVLWDSLA